MAFGSGNAPSGEPSPLAKPVSSCRRRMRVVIGSSAVECLRSVRCCVASMVRHGIVLWVVLGVACVVTIALYSTTFWLLPQVGTMV